jgi:MFS family permease
MARPGYVIGAAYLAGGVCIFALSLFGVLSPALTALVFSAGFCMSGAQTGLNAFAPGCYPTVARATGVSWMLGVGRFGSIAGSAFGGALLGLGWGFTAILGILAIQRPARRSRSHSLSSEMPARRRGRTLPTERRMLYMNDEVACALVCSWPV